MKFLLPLFCLVALSYLSGASLPIAAGEHSPKKAKTTQAVIKIDKTRLQTVPDPGSALLLGIAGTLVLFRRRLR
jgi:hypothetical protein